MKGELERRSFLCEVRAERGDDDTGVIEGRPVVYGSRTRIRDWCGEWDEEIVAGALDRTDLTDVRFLVNHDLNKIPLARSRRNNGNSTMQLITDSEGLKIRAILDTENNAEAKSLYSAVARGDISGMSFMFSVRDEEWDDEDQDVPVRKVLSIGSIVEVSACTFPAYSATEIFARSKDAPEGARSPLEKVRQQRAAALEKAEVEMLKLKIKISGGK